MRFLRAAVLTALVLCLALSGRGAGIAPSAEAAVPLKAGAAAPNVSVLTAEQREFSLGSAFARQPTILVFYRGSWCPYCNIQLAALGEAEPKLLALGYQILAVSPDTAEGLHAMTAKLHLNYQLLSDRSM